VGGNLAQILDTISDTINNRVRMRREIMTLTAQGRASGVVLALMPVGVGFIMSLVNPTYLRPLFEEPVGQACVAGAIVMEIIGFLVIRRIVNIKF
jgi:tight adherence protein B